MHLFSLDPVGCGGYCHLTYGAGTGAPVLILVGSLALVLWEMEDKLVSAVGFGKEILNIRLGWFPMMSWGFSATTIRSTGQHFPNCIRCEPSAYPGCRRIRRIHDIVLFDHKLVRFAHNWNNGMLELWNIGLMGSGIMEWWV